MNKQRKTNKKFQGKELIKLKQIYSTTKDAKIKDRCRIIILRSKGYKVEEITDILDLGSKTVKEWSSIFIKHGAQGFLPKKRIPSNKFLSEQDKKQLKKDLKSKPKKFGFIDEPFWTLNLLKIHIKKKFKIVYKSDQSYYELFEYCGYSCHKPRPQDKRQDKDKIDKFMKNTEVLLKKGHQKVTLSW